MTKTYNEPINQFKLAQFDELLKKTGGYYLSSPRVSPDQYGYYRVDYSFETIECSNRFSKAWNTFNSEITEKRSDQKWRVMARRIKFYLKFWRMFK